MTPKRGGARVAQVVVTDTPSFPGQMNLSYKEEATVQLVATNGAGVSQKWEYTFMLTCGAGRPPVFQCSQPKGTLSSGQ